MLKFGLASLALASVVAGCEAPLKEVVSPCPFVRKIYSAKKDTVPGSVSIRDARRKGFLETSVRPARNANRVTGAAKQLGLLLWKLSLWIGNCGRPV